MRVHVNGRFLTQPLSGVQRYAHEILRALDDLSQGQGAEVEVLVPRPVTFPGWRNLRLRVLPGGAGHLWEQTALYQASRDGILVSLCNAGPLRHRAQVLCLHDAHLYQMPQAYARRYQMAHRVLRPLLARRAAALLTVSQTSAAALSQHLGLPQTRFRVVPNAADHILRLPSDPTAPARHGLAAGGYLLSVGNQSPNKNLARLCAAHAACNTVVPPLAIVGGFAPGVRPKHVGPSARLRLLGRVPDTDLRGLYEGAAGFVFPSLNEGFGIPPLEAMQLGVPVLAARSGALPEVLGSTPMWFDPKDTSAITRTLEHFAALGATARAALRDDGLTRAALYRWEYSATLLWRTVKETQAILRSAA